MNILRILKGWGKAFGFISTTTAELELSKLRLSICKICENSEPVKLLNIIHGKATYPINLMCNKCKCPCLEKSLVIEEKCPIKKW